MLKLENEFKAALTRAGFRLDGDDWAARLEGVPVRVKVAQSTFNLTALQWAALTVTIEDPRIVGQCHVTPGAFFATASSLDELPAVAQLAFSTVLLPTSVIMAVDAGVMKGVAWAAHRSQGLKTHNEAEWTPFRLRYDLLAPSHEAAVAGCPDALQYELVGSNFMGSFWVTPGKMVIEPLIWAEKNVDPFVDSLPRLVKAATVARS